MITSTGLAILALFVTSLVVRVLPAFLGIRISGTLGMLLERVLPTAVFLNFAVYIIFTEMKTAPLPAFLAIAAVAAMTLLTRAGLIMTACIGSLIYAMTIIAASS